MSCVYVRMRIIKNTRIDFFPTKFWKGVLIMADKEMEMRRFIADLVEDGMLTQKQADLLTDDDIREIMKEIED